MIQSSHTASALPLHSLMIRRRRALIVAPPAGAALALPIDDLPDDGVERDWKDDLGFFLAAYVAGLLFFLVMLS